MEDAFYKKVVRDRRFFSQYNVSIHMGVGWQFTEICTSHAWILFPLVSHVFMVTRCRLIVAHKWSRKYGAWRCRDVSGAQNIPISILPCPIPVAISHCIVRALVPIPTFKYLFRFGLLNFNFESIFVCDGDVLFHPCAFDHLEPASKSARRIVICTSQLIRYLFFISSDAMCGQPIISSIFHLSPFSIFGS